jgi:hypothetical protein
MCSQAHEALYDVEARMPTWISPLRRLTGAPERRASYDAGTWLALAECAATVCALAKGQRRV